MRKHYKSSENNNLPVYPGGVVARETSVIAKRARELRRKRQPKEGWVRSTACWKTRGTTEGIKKACEKQADVNDEQKGASFLGEKGAGVHGDLNRDKFFLKISRIVAFFTGYLLKTMVLCWIAKGGGKYYGARRFATTYKRNRVLFATTKIADEGRVRIRIENYWTKVPAVKNYEGRQWVVKKTIRYCLR